jgi:protein AFG1
MEQGKLQSDRAQEQAARRLYRLQRALQGYDNVAHTAFVRQLHIEQDKEKENTDNDMDDHDNKNGNDDGADSSNDETSEEPPPPLAPIPRGLFIHGHVGTGKSMLMDMFFHQAPIEKKRRVHFHSFLQDVHQRIHALKQDDLQTRGRDFTVDTSTQRNPIYRVAHQIASEVTLLCFDEFQVTDVADALILKQLFEVLFQCGTVTVATSNRPPSDLYEGGLNRDYFLPFLDLLHQYCIVHELESRVDYRTLLSEDLEEFFVVSNEKDAEFCATFTQCDAIFERLLQGEAPISMELMSAFNRSLTVRQAHPDGRFVARFQFDELCNRELGSSDYRALAEQFDIVILEEIPLLTLKDHDQARRFITLIDELYEGNCALFCSAVAFPDALFVDRLQEVPAPDSVEAKVGEMFGIDVAQSSGKTVGELASVRELSFAFRRAASRLTQMCSRQWWDKVLLNANDR